MVIHIICSEQSPNETEEVAVEGEESLTIFVLSLVSTGRWEFLKMFRNLAEFEAETWIEDDQN